MIGPQARQFLDRYPYEYAVLRERAILLEQYLARLLEPGAFDLHTISARAKRPDSVRAKILRKHYGHPAMQMTDRLAARVITYFAEDVDRVTAELRALLDVDDRHSSDKRASLALREFGYRSVHLVAKPKPSTLGMDHADLKGQKFELQIRSVLEHAWAEIEHEVIYKAGMASDGEERRRFSAIAGTLELLEQEFGSLRHYRNTLIVAHVEQLEGGTEVDLKLDAPWLLAVLEVTRPDGLSWRVAETSGRPFPPRIDADCVSALGQVGVTTTALLVEKLRSDSFGDVLTQYAVATGTVPSKVSHLITTILLIAWLDQGVASDYFPSIISAPEVRESLTA